MKEGTSKPKGVKNWDDAAQVTKAVKRDGFLLKNASEKLRGDAGVVTKAVQTDGAALQHADLSGILRGNRKVALTAVRQDGEALEFVPSDLRSDREVRQNMQLAQYPA